jgi:hypothetical protein
MVRSALTRSGRTIGPIAGVSAHRPVPGNDVFPEQDQEQPTGAVKDPVVPGRVSRVGIDLRLTLTPESGREVASAAPAQLLSGSIPTGASFEACKAHDQADGASCQCPAETSVSGPVPGRARESPVLRSEVSPTTGRRAAPSGMPPLPVELTQGPQMARQTLPRTADDPLGPVAGRRNRLQGCGHSSIAAGQPGRGAGRRSGARGDEPPGA